MSITPSWSRPMRTFAEECAEAGATVSFSQTTEITFGYDGQPLRFTYVKFVAQFPGGDSALGVWTLNQRTNRWVYSFGTVGEDDGNGIPQNTLLGTISLLS